MADIADNFVPQGARGLSRRKHILPSKVYKELIKSDTHGVHTWLNPQVRNARLRTVGAGLAAAGIAGLAGIQYGARQLYNYVNSTTMPPTRSTKRYVPKRRAYRLKRRYRKMARRAPKRRYMKKRRYVKRKGGDLFIKNLRKAKRLRMYMKPWRMTNTYRRGCDFINLGHLEFPTDAVSGNAPLAQYKTLEFNPTQLPNLQAILGNEFGKFKEYRIDRITYKVVVINARRLAMEPNYIPPDGSGVEGENHMAHPEEYAKKNSYVFHYRQENDDINDGVFSDWSRFQFAKPGTLQYVNVFRQKGKMFKCPVTTTIRTQIGTGTGTHSDFLNRDLHGARLGWIDKDLVFQERINLGKAGILAPGVRHKGWDGTTDNPRPKLEVSCRVCWSARECGFSTDQI